MPNIPIGSNAPSTWDSDLAALIAQMNSSGYTQLATEFQAYATTFHQQYPGYTVSQALSAFLATDLGKSLSAGLGGTSAVLGKLINTIPAAVNAATTVPGIGAITDVNAFLSRLTSMNTWIRVGEFILGALLILAGALKLSGQSADIGDITKMATKVIR